VKTREPQLEAVALCDKAEDRSRHFTHGIERAVNHVVEYHYLDSAVRVALLIGSAADLSGVLDVYA
jgi:hypothetical protein